MKAGLKNSIHYLAKVNNFRESIFDQIARERSNQIWLTSSLKDIKRVVLINSAPRSGSSLLFALLRKIPGIYSLSGESVPFYKLHGLLSDSFSSDRIPNECADRISSDIQFSRDFLSDLSFTNKQNRIMHDKESLERYIEDLILRFSLQWPQISFSDKLFRKIALRAFAIYSKNYQEFYPEAFYLELLENLRSEHPSINPYYYDLSQEAVREKFPDLGVPLGPPNDILTIEEPPFILLSPGRKVRGKDLSERALLLKSTGDCYRMNYIKKIFSSATIMVIHLIRNPAASINGLYDGWLHRGFFSHNLKDLFAADNKKFKGLAIPGYSDRFAWGEWWWNYDLPSGWQDYCRRKLEEVCAFQWYSAQKAIVEYKKRETIPFCQVQYENLVKNRDLRSIEIRKILDFIGLNTNTAEVLGADPLPVVQATQPPQHYRWKQKRDKILPVLDNCHMNDMCRELGYDQGNIEQWV